MSTGWHFIHQFLFSDNWNYYDENSTLDLILSLGFFINHLLLAQLCTRFYNKIIIKHKLMFKAFVLIHFFLQRVIRKLFCLFQPYFVLPLPRGQKLSFSILSFTLYRTGKILYQYFFKYWLNISMVIIYFNGI